MDVIDYMYSRGLHLLPVRQNRSILRGSNKAITDLDTIKTYPLYGISGRTHYILDVDIGDRGTTTKVGNLTLKNLPLYNQDTVIPEYVVISKSGGIHLYYRKFDTSKAQRSLPLRDIDYITVGKWVVGPMEVLGIDEEFSYEGLWDVRDRARRGEYQLVQYKDDLAERADYIKDGIEEGKFRELCTYNPLRLPEVVKRDLRKVRCSSEVDAPRGNADGIDNLVSYQSVGSQIWAGSLPTTIRRGERDNAIYAYITKLVADGLSLDECKVRAVEFYNDRIKDKEGFNEHIIRDKVQRVYESQGFTLSEITSGEVSEEAKKVIADAGGGLSCVFRGRSGVALNESEFHTRVIADMFDDDFAGLYAVANGMREGLSYILVGPLASGPMRFHHLNEGMVKKWLEAFYYYIDDKGRKVISLSHITAKMMTERTDRMREGITMVKGRNFPDHINLWIDPRETATKWASYSNDSGIIKEWVEFQEYLLGAGNVALGTEWVAFLLQKPEQKPGFAIMLESERFGVGKSLWSDIICRLQGINRAGKDQGVRRDLGELFARFFDAQASVIFLDEVQTDRAEQRKLWARMKTLITETTIVVEPKGKQSYNSTSTAGVIIAANSGHNLNVYGDSRRLWHIKIDDHLTEVKRFPILQRFRQEAGEQTDWYKGAYAELINYYLRVRITSPIEYLVPPMSNSKVELLNTNISISMRGFLGYIRRRGLLDLTCIPALMMTELAQDYMSHQGSVDELLEVWKVHNRSMLSFRYYDASVLVLTGGKLAKVSQKNQVWWCLDLAKRDDTIKEWTSHYYQWMHLNQDALGINRKDPLYNELMRKVVRVTNACTLSQLKNDID
jgi:hypothetical protein